MPLLFVVRNFKILKYLCDDMLIDRLVQHVTLQINCLSIILSKFPPLSTEMKMLYIFSACASDQRKADSKYKWTASFKVKSSQVSDLSLTPPVQCQISVAAVWARGSETSKFHGCHRTVPYSLCPRSRRNLSCPPRGKLESVPSPSLALHSVF